MKCRCTINNKEYEYEQHTKGYIVDRATICERETYELEDVDHIIIKKKSYLGGIFGFRI